MQQMIDRPFQYAAGKRLIQAMLGKAVEDCCLPTPHDSPISPDAASAFRFLFGLDSYLPAYCDLVGLDAKPFRDKITLRMAEAGSETLYSEEQKNNFQANALHFYATHLGLERARLAAL